MRTRSQRSQRSDGSHELSPVPPVSLSSLPEAVLEHTLTFVDENDDARCRAISQSWAGLRRVWVVSRLRTDPGRSQTGQITAVAFSPDDALLAVGAKDNVLKVHNAATGDLLHTFHNENWTNSVAFSPTDSTLLVAAYGARINIYNLLTGDSRELWRPRQWRSANMVAVSPTGATIAFHCYSSVAVIGQNGWFTPERALVENTHYRVRGVAFSATGAVLAVGIGRKVKCFDVATGQVCTVIKFGVDVWSIAYSPRGIVSVGGDDGKLAFYDAATGQLRRELRSVSSEGRAILESCFSPDGSMFAAQGPDVLTGRIEIYDAETGELRRVLSRAVRNIGGVTFSPDGKTLAVGDYLGRVVLYDAATGDLRRMRRPPPTA